MDLTKEVVRASMVATKDLSTWESVALRQRTVTHLISVGAEWRLNNNLSRAQAYSIFCVLQMQFLLDAQLGKVPPTDIVRCVSRPGRDMTHDPARATAMFLCKKVECRCLDGLKLVYKNDVKVGLCSVCRKKSERKKLLQCSRCEMIQYCSKECQVKDWPNHKDACRHNATEHEKMVQIAKEGKIKQWADQRAVDGVYSEDNWDKELRGGKDAK
ncbi:hypothetical protein ACHAXT_011871 [Thalassiosira profunda]